MTTMPNNTSADRVILGATQGKTLWYICTIASGAGIYKNRRSTVRPKCAAVNNRFWASKRPANAAAIVDMRTLFLILTVAFFTSAMVCYGIYLAKSRQPLSFFDLRDAAKTGNTFAKWIVALWGAAIVCAVVFGIAFHTIYFQ